MPDGIGRISAALESWDSIRLGNCDNFKIRALAPQVPKSARCGWLGVCTGPDLRVSARPFDLSAREEPRNSHFDFVLSFLRLSCVFFAGAGGAGGVSGE